MPSYLKSLFQRCLNPSRSYLSILWVCSQDLINLRSVVGCWPNRNTMKRPWIWWWMKVRYRILPSRLSVHRRYQYHCSHLIHLCFGWWCWPLQEAPLLDTSLCRDRLSPTLCPKADRRKKTSNEQSATGALPRATLCLTLEISIPGVSLNVRFSRESKHFCVVDKPRAPSHHVFIFDYRCLGNGRFELSFQYWPL